MKTKTYLFRVAVLCSAAILTLASATPVFAQRGFDRGGDTTTPRSNSNFLYAFRDATETASKSTVRVLCDGKEAALGTIVGADGWILTKASELTGTVTCKTKDGKVLEAKIVGEHPAYDLAMLKVEATDLTPVKFEKSDKAPVGNWLASAGLGDNPVAVGVMSVAARTPRDPGRPLNPKRGYLGIQMEQTEGGVKITVVSPKSPAARGGVLVNDKIVSLNGQTVTDMEGMQSLMGKTKKDEVVKLKVKRGDDEKELSITLGAVPADRGDFQNDLGSKLSDRKTGFPTYFQHDTVIGVKDCGGPICDLEGHVLGVNIARAGRTESYAIPTEVLTPVIADLKSGKLAPPKPDLAKKIAELTAAFKKAEEEKLAAEKSLTELKETLKKQEEANAAAEKRVKDAKAALEKAEKEAKDKK